MEEQSSDCIRRSDRMHLKWLIASLRFLCKGGQAVWFLSDYYSFFLKDSAASVSMIADIAATSKRSSVRGNSGPRGGVPLRSSTCLNASMP